MTRKYKVVVSMVLISEDDEILYTGADTGEIVTKLKDWMPGDVDSFVKDEGPSLVDMAKLKIVDWFRS